MHFSFKMLAAASALSLIGLTGSALANPESDGLRHYGLTFAGDLHAQSQYNFRGQEFSAGEPSIGLKAHLIHDSGFYGSLGTDTVKLGNFTTGDLGSDRHQFHNTLTVGHASAITPNFTLKAGATHNLFSGRDNVNDLSFTEVFAEGQYKGARLFVGHTVNGSRLSAPGFTKGDTYAQLGYLHSFGPRNEFSLGADIGYTWYDARRFTGLDNGMSLAQLQAGYAYDDHLSFKLVHQFAGKNAFGEQSSANHNTSLTATYRF